MGETNLSDTRIEKEMRIEEAFELLPSRGEKLDTGSIRILQRSKREMNLTSISSRKTPVQRKSVVGVVLGRPMRSLEPKVELRSEDVPPVPTFLLSRQNLTPSKRPIPPTRRRKRQRIAKISSPPSLELHRVLGPPSLPCLCLSQETEFDFKV